MIPRWLPNALSVARIVAIPGWLALAFVARAHALASEPNEHVLVIALLVAIGLTDVVDGFLARRFQLVTNLGAILDAVADKLATFAVVTFLVFWAPPLFTPLPLWFLVLLLTRDLLLAIGFTMVRIKHGTVSVEHRWHGRLATLLLFATVVAACCGAPHVLVLAGVALVTALSIPGTVDYVREGLRQLDRGREIEVRRQ